MLRTSRNAVVLSGLPLCVFCAVRNSVCRQRLLVRSIHSSGKSSEGEPARLLDERPRPVYQGFSSRPLDGSLRTGYQGLSSRPPDERPRPVYQGFSSRPPDGSLRTGYQGLSSRPPDERPRPVYQGLSSRPPDERPRTGYQGLSSRPPDERPRTGYQGLSSRPLDERPRTGYQGLSGRPPGERPRAEYQGLSNRPLDERPRTEHQGFFKRPPAAIRDPDSKWARDNATMGSSVIDSAILSSFASPRNSGASWSRGPSTSTSAPPRIDRASNYRRAGPVGSGSQVDNRAPYVSGERYRSPSSQSQTGYKGHSSNLDETSRWTFRDSQTSTYIPGTGYTGPVPVNPGYRPRDAIPAWQQQGARTWQDTSGQDRREGSYGGHSRGGYESTQDLPQQYGYGSRNDPRLIPQQSGVKDGYQPQEGLPDPPAEEGKLGLRPVEYVNNEYEKRRAGKIRDKTRAGRGFDEFESAILEDEAPQQDKKAARRAMRAKKRESREEAPKMIPLFLPEYISVPNLAKALKIRLDDFLGQMKQMGFTDMSHDHILNAETAGLIAMEYNYEPIADRSAERDLLPRPPPEDRSILPPRPPVVTIMGHVDHGKTSLLDWLRKASVAASEHGGITQHIGAFSVNMPSGKNITFLDTPGHAAFLSMRERGANVTDIVILVVAADDSVKPQTIEAIKHAKAANVPIIVAATKVDKEEADVERVKQDLARHGVDVEDYGGDTQVVSVSARTGQGMGDLEEATVTLSEVLDMRAEDDGPCEGWILEASKKDIGRVATILVRRGTLRTGDAIVAGQTWCKVRQITNEHGVKVECAGPGVPVEVAGWKDQPEAGQLAIQAESEEKAKDVVDFRREKAERLRQAADIEAINEKRRLHREREEMETAIREEAKEKKEDPDVAVAAWEKTTRQEVAAQPKNQEVLFIVKGDVAGSVEAVVESISSLGNDEVQAKVVRSDFGGVSEFDVDYAAAVEGYVLCFNIAVDPEIVVYAREKAVTILSHNIIYHLADDVTRLLSDRLSPTVIYNVTGEAEIIQVFSINIKGKQQKPVAGCKVKTGVIAKNSKVRVVRDGKNIFEGQLNSLKHVQKDVSDMKRGGECGMGFEGWGEFEVGDTVQCYEVKLEPRTL